MPHSSVILALTLVSGFGTPYDDDWPPQRFRATGTTTVIFAAAQAEIDRWCGRAPKGKVTEGCTRDDGIEVLPDPCLYQGEYARIGCHENAHRFGGWPADHPR